MQSVWVFVLAIAGFLVFSALQSKANEQPPQQHEGTAAAMAAYAAMLKDVPAPMPAVPAVQPVSEKKTVQPQRQCGPEGCPLVSPAPREPSQQKPSPNVEQPSRQPTQTYVRRGRFGSRRACCR